MTPRASNTKVATPERRLVLGLHPVREAIRAHGAAVEEVLVASGAGPLPDKLARFAADQGIRTVRRVPRSALDRLARGVAHQDAAAWAPLIQLLAPEDLFRTEAFVGIALDAIQDPQNFGAVIRSAVGLCRAAVIWAEHASAPLSPATFRASAGSIEHARLCRVPSLAGALALARSLGIQVVGLDPRASHPLAHTNLTIPTVLVVGSEHRGLRGAVRAQCDVLASLSPTLGIDSLNAAVAAGIALYEAGKQRIISNS